MRRRGVEVKNIVLPADATQEELIAEIEKINKDPSIHGCLLFRPLPSIWTMIRSEGHWPGKGCGRYNGYFYGVYSGSNLGFPRVHLRHAWKYLILQY